MRLAGLDALRGIAAFAVAAHHLYRGYGGQEQFVHPQLAVDLFFILSGFVMARTYEGRMQQGLTAGRFVALRYRRLFFPMFVGSTIGYLWSLAYYGPSLDIAASYLAILAFMPAIWINIAFLVNGPAWSLFLEILANALHGAALGKLSKGPLALLWAAVTVTFLVSYNAGAGWDYSLDAVLGLIPRALSCYLMGILLFRHYGDKPLGYRPGLAIVAFALLMSASAFHPLIELASILICWPLIIRASLSLPSFRWALWIGALSFPLYATHSPIFRVAVMWGLHPVSAVIFALSIAGVVTIWHEALGRDKRYELRIAPWGLSA